MLMKLVILTFFLVLRLGLHIKIIGLFTSILRKKSITEVGTKLKIFENQYLTQPHDLGRTNVIKPAQVLDKDQKF